MVLAAACSDHLSVSDKIIDIHTDPRTSDLTVNLGRCGSISQQFLQAAIAEATAVVGTVVAPVADVIVVGRILRGGGNDKQRALILEQV